MKVSCRYFDGVHAIEHAYQLDVGIGIVTLIDPETRQKKVHWQMDDIRVVQSPTHTTSGKLSCLKEPDARLIIPLKDDWDAVMAMLPKKHRPKSYVSLKWRMMPVYFVLSIVAFVGLVVGVPKLMSASVIFVPKVVEQKLGDRFVQDLKDDLGECRQKEGRAALDHMVTALQASSVLKDTNFVVTVVPSDFENALAFPGTSIVVFGELIKNAESPEELAFVLSHEVGHINNRHAMRGFLQSQGLSFIMQMMMGDISVMGGGVSDVVGTLGNLHNSRDHENEADQFALSVAADIDMDHTKATSFFERVGMEAIESFVPEWISTHPNTKERIQTINAFHKNEGIQYKPILSADEWVALKSICEE